jgi:hypothetical protein
MASCWSHGLALQPRGLPSKNRIFVNKISSLYATPITKWSGVDKFYDADENKYGGSISLNTVPQGKGRPGYATVRQATSVPLRADGPITLAGYREGLMAADCLDQEQVRHDAASSRVAGVTAFKRLM